MFKRFIKGGYSPVLTLQYNFVELNSDQLFPHSSLHTDLSGLATDADESSVDGDILRSNPVSSVEASPQRGDRGDRAHLTSSGSYQRLPPMEPDRSPTEQEVRDSEKAHRGSWNGILDGARNLLDAIIDLGASDSDDNVDEDHVNRIRGTSPHLRTSPIPSPAGYPTVTSTIDEEVSEGPLGDTTEPTPLKVAHPNQSMPTMSEPSALLTEDDIRSLAAEVPLRHRQAQWRLLYSTQRDGISMQTMLRNARGQSPTVLVVRDMGRSVFGAFCSEPWKLSPRYYGTGETFVFQVSPRQVAWHWWHKKMKECQNDFFMWTQSDAMAIGGTGGYAVWLDEELARGISRTSATFGNDSLSSSEEFRIGAVELWWLA